MKTFNYKTISCPVAALNNTLYEYGEQGFELVQVLQDYQPNFHKLIFKKEVEKNDK